MTGERTLAYVLTVTSAGEVEGVGTLDLRNEREDAWPLPSA